MASLLEVHKTGLTHRTRVPMSALKHPDLESDLPHQLRVRKSALTRPCRGDSAYGADPNLAQRLGPERRRPQGTRLGVEHLDTGQYVESGWKYLDHLAHALDVVRGLD